MFLKWLTIILILNLVLLTIGMWLAVYVWILHANNLNSAGRGWPCELRKYSPSGYVCVCNATYCDTLEEESLQLSEGDSDQILVLTTSARGLRFERFLGSWRNNRPIVIPDLQRYDNAPEVVPLTKQIISAIRKDNSHRSKHANIIIDESITHQKMIGFGGALSRAAVHNLESIPRQLKQFLLESYYSETKGLAYNMLRMTIGGSDFDIFPWSYNESPTNDGNLSNFTKLDPRDLQLVENIRKIKEILSETSQGSLKIEVSAWRCPSWMRSTIEKDGPGPIKPEFYQSWAEYHLKYLRLMKSQGIDIWAVALGNEPLNGNLGWLMHSSNHVGWSPAEFGEFVVNYFGPTLRNSEFGNISILASDDHRSIFSLFFEEVVLHSPAVIDYIDGFALRSHYDAFLVPNQKDLSKSAYPNKFLLSTEASIGDIHRHNPQGPVLGSWDRAAEYIRRAMESLSFGVAGLMDWNLMLDERGGPNYFGNLVESPVVINSRDEEAYKQPTFYAIGHFSRFIKKDSLRISAISDWINVSPVAFRRPDNTTVVIIHNTHKNTTEVSIRDVRRGIETRKTFVLPPESISTVVYRGGCC